MLCSALHHAANSYCKNDHHFTRQIWVSQVPLGFITLLFQNKTSEQYHEGGTAFLLARCPYVT